MKHPYEKIMIIEIGSLIAVIVIGIIALLQKSALFIFLCLYLLVLSMGCDALIHWYMYQQQEATKQFLRAMTLFLFVTFLLFHK